MISQLFSSRSFYEQKSPTRCEGRLAWAPVLYLPNKSDPCILMQTPDGDLQPVKVEPSHFTSRSHPPTISPLRLDINSELVMVQAKKRPVILLAADRYPELWSIGHGLGQVKARLRPGVGWLAVPLYDYAAEPDFQCLVESLYFPQFFPMLGNGACPQYDSFARFDRMQTVHESLIEPSDYVVKSTEDKMLSLVYEAAVSYIRGMLVGEAYPLLRQMFLQELKEKGTIVWPCAKPSV